LFDNVKRSQFILVVLTRSLLLQVSDPIQQGDGLNKHISYRVDIRPQAPTPGDLPQEVILTGTTMYSSVLRRYSDFHWLYDRLHIERAGSIVPPIPDKHPVGRFSPAFVEERRVQLERFLRRVAVHPELADAPSLDTFFRADDGTFQAAKQAKGNVPMMNSSQMMTPMYPPQMGPSPKKEGLKRWFAETKTSMTGDLVRSPDDDLFEEIQRYIHGLDTQMKNVSQQVSGLVRKGKEMANGLFEFGLAFNLLGQSEGDALGDALSKMGETADRLSVLSAEHSDQEMSQFEEPLQDYIKLIHAAKLALQRRHEKRLSYSTCLAEVESKQALLGKLRAQIGSEAKAYSMEMSLRQAHDAAEVAREDFATVSQRVLREVDRFKREKAEEMRWTVLTYIQLQVDYNKRMEQVWAHLIPQLEGVQVDGNSTSGSQQQPQQQHQQIPAQTVVQQQVPVNHQPVIQHAHDIPQYDMTASQMAHPPPLGGTSVPGGDPMISIQYRD
jgi:sorting nexin-1/2